MTEKNEGTDNVQMHKKEVIDAIDKITYVNATLARDPGDGSKWLWTIAGCPFCGERHNHTGGSVTTANPYNRLGIMVAAPCGGGNYTLKESVN